MVAELYNELVLTAGDLSGNLTSTAKELAGGTGLCVQAVWTGTSPVGVLTLQGSLDGTTYTDVSPQNVSGNAGSSMWNIECPVYKFFRMSYVFGSGVGTINIRARAVKY